MYYYFPLKVRDSKTRYLVWSYSECAVRVWKACTLQVFYVLVTILHYVFIFEFCSYYLLRLRFSRVAECVLHKLFYVFAFWIFKRRKYPEKKLILICSKGRVCTDEECVNNNCFWSHEYSFCVCKIKRTLLPKFCSNFGKVFLRITRGRCTLVQREVVGTMFASFPFPRRENVAREFS